MSVQILAIGSPRERGTAGNCIRLEFSARTTDISTLCDMRYLVNIELAMTVL
jgi:hypothetical protein